LIEHVNERGLADPPFTVHDSVKPLILNGADERPQLLFSAREDRLIRDGHRRTKGVTDANPQLCEAVREARVNLIAGVGLKARKIWPSIQAIPVTEV
jgi:hypothetical protein